HPRRARPRPAAIALTERECKPGGRAFRRDSGATAPASKRSRGPAIGDRRGSRARRKALPPGDLLTHSGIANSRRGSVGALRRRQLRGRVALDAAARAADAEAARGRLEDDPPPPADVRRALVSTSVDETRDDLARAAGGIHVGGSLRAGLRKRARDAT